MRVLWSQGWVSRLCGLQMLIVVVLICTFLSTTAATKLLVIYYLSIGNLVIFYVVIEGLRERTEYVLQQ